MCIILDTIIDSPSDKNNVKTVLFNRLSNEESTNYSVAITNFKKLVLHRNSSKVQKNENITCSRYTYFNTKAYKEATNLDLLIEIYSNAWEKSKEVK